MRYATGSNPRKNPGVPRGLQIFPIEKSIEEPATGQIFQNYVLSRNVANLLNIKVLKSDILC